MNFGPDANAPVSYTLSGAGITLSGPNAQIIISGLDPNTKSRDDRFANDHNVISGSLPTGTKPTDPIQHH